MGYLTKRFNLIVASCRSPDKVLSHRGHHTVSFFPRPQERYYSH